MPEWENLAFGGIGKILALTIMLEVGDINRFDKVGNYSSYCRCLRSEQVSAIRKKERRRRRRRTATNI